MKAHATTVCALCDHAIGWLIDHHVQTANRHAVRRIKEKP
jgi:hypothetical protein